MIIFFEGNYDIIKLLVERGANLEARDPFGNTPLKLAAGWGINSNELIRINKNLSGMN